MLHVLVIEQTLAQVFVHTREMHCTLPGCSLHWIRVIQILVCHFKGKLDETPCFSSLSSELEPLLVIGQHGGCQVVLLAGNLTGCIIVLHQKEEGGALVVPLKFLKDHGEQIC